MNTFVAVVLTMGRSEKGATAVEYGIMLGGIAAVVVGTVLLLGPPVAEMFQPVVAGLGN